MGLTTTGLGLPITKGFVELLGGSIRVHGKGFELATIFDKCRQVEGSDRERRGRELGLSITKQFAELLVGSIGVESEVGKGSTFTVRVPVIYRES